MPCFTVRQTSVTLEDRDPELLSQALMALGYAVSKTANGLVFSGRNTETGIYNSGAYTNGRLAYSGTLEINQVKRAYSEQAVSYAAKKFGWNLTKVSQNQYQAQKR